MPHNPYPATPTLRLINRLVGEIRGLASIESRLVRAELREAFANAVKGVVFLAGGAGLLIAGIFVLLGAIVLFLIRLGVAPDLSCLIVAVVLLVIGAILCLLGRNRLKPANLALPRTMAQFSTSGMDEP